MTALAVRFWKPLAGLVVLAILAGAIWWLRADAYRDGAKANEAQWLAASARIQRAADRMRASADVLAAAREQQTTTDIKELRDEAAKGTADPVGPGVSAVLERLRAAQGR